MLIDKALQQRVMEELDFEPAVNAAHIGVSVRDGVVALTGHVESYGEKLAAEQAARRVKGVKGIAQEIDVRLPSDRQRTDDEIARRALQMLHWDVSVESEGISVKVERGVITLIGEVEWQFQRAQAESDVRQLSGVVDVINQIRVRPRIAAADVQRTILQAFERNAILEAAGITVEVSGGRVTLTGEVQEMVERDIAERAAWSAPGVTEVVDRIVVRH